MCDYYTINQNPGNSQKIKVRTDKFAFLDDDKISASLLNYKDKHQTFITFYVPQIHCSSCLWLLENLHKLNKAVVSSKVNFSRKEVDVIFNHEETNLRKVAELLVDCQLVVLSHIPICEAVGQSKTERQAVRKATQLGSKVQTISRRLLFKETFGKSFSDIISGRTYFIKEWNASARFLVPDA